MFMIIGFLLVSFMLNNRFKAFHIRSCRAFKSDYCQFPMLISHSCTHSHIFNTKRLTYHSRFYQFSRLFDSGGYFPSFDGSRNSDILGSGLNPKVVVKSSRYYKDIISIKGDAKNEMKNRLFNLREIFVGLLSKFRRRLISFMSANDEPINYGFDDRQNRQLMAIKSLVKKNPSVVKILDTVLEKYSTQLSRRNSFSRDLLKFIRDGYAQKYQPLMPTLNDLFNLVFGISKFVVGNTAALENKNTVLNRDRDRSASIIPIWVAAEAAKNNSKIARSIHNFFLTATKDSILEGECLENMFAELVFIKLMMACEVKKQVSLIHLFRYNSSWNEDLDSRKLLNFYPFPMDVSASSSASLANVVDECSNHPSQVDNTSCRVLEMSKTLDFKDPKYNLHSELLQWDSSVPLFFRQNISLGARMDREWVFDSTRHILFNFGNKSMQNMRSFSGTLSRSEYPRFWLELSDLGRHSRLPVVLMARPCDHYDFLLKFWTVEPCSTTLPDDQSCGESKHPTSDIPRNTVAKYWFVELKSCRETAYNDRMEKESFGRRDLRDLRDLEEKKIQLLEHGFREDCGDEIDSSFRSLDLSSGDKHQAINVLQSLAKWNRNHPNKSIDMKDVHYSYVVSHPLVLRSSLLKLQNDLYRYNFDPKCVSVLSRDLVLSFFGPFFELYRAGRIQAEH